MQSIPHPFNAAYSPLLTLLTYAATHRHSHQWLSAIPAILARRGGAAHG
jgi:hypothetical protein